MTKGASHVQSAPFFDLGRGSAPRCRGGLSRPGHAQENQAAGMITPAAQDAIDAGLDYLARRQNPNGSFGTGQYAENVAITSLAGLAFMAGGHQPDRGRYGSHVTKAVKNILDHETRAPHGATGYLNNPNRAAL